MKCYPSNPAWESCVGVLTEGREKGSGTFYYFSVRLASNIGYVRLYSGIDVLVFLRIVEAFTVN